MTQQQYQLGDVILAHGKGMISHLIRFGEAIKWRGFSQWNHAAIVIEVEPKVMVAQATGRGVVKAPIEQVAPGGHIAVKRAPLDPANIKQAVDYAKSRIGDRYGFLTIGSIIINILTPSFFRIDVRLGGTLICSALVARSLEHGGWDCPTDPFQISPAQLAKALGV